jgi:hypothetical protein
MLPALLPGARQAESAALRLAMCLDITGQLEA